MLLMKRRILKLRCPGDAEVSLYCCFSGREGHAVPKAYSTHEPQKQLPCRSFESEL